MAQEIKSKVVVLEPCTETVEGLLKAISDKKQAEIVRVSIPEEAGQLVRQFQPCMLVMCLNDNTELPQRVTVLKGLEGSIKYGLLKTLFVSKVKNKQIGTLITSLGVTDFMEEPVPLRTLQFKANLQLKAVETIRKQQEMKKASQEKIVFKKSGEKGAEAAAGDGQAKPTPALQLDEDAFLFKNSGVKKHGKKHMIELEGPDPESGEWVPHEDKGDAQTSWRWVPEEEKETPEAKRGDGWVAEGDKPQFQEASNKWQFASEKPELAYQKNGKKVAKKVAVNAAGEVTVAADSPTAEANIKKAKATGEKKKKEKQAKKIKEAEEKEKKAKAEAIKAETAKAGKEEPAKSGKETEPKEKAGKIGESSSSPEAGKDAPEIAIGASAKKERQEKNSIGENVVDLKEKREQKEKKAALSPLEFLKQKKEKNQTKAIGEPSEEKAKNEGPIGESPSDPAPVNDRQAENDSIGETPELRDRRKKGSDPLDRFKNLLNEDLPEEKSEEEAASLIADDPSREEQTDEEEPLDSAAKDEKAKRQKENKTPIEEEKKEKAKPEKAAAKGKASREKKQDVIRQIQEMLSEPLPEELPPEEEARLRKKFNLENSGDIGPKELARRERKSKIDALKQSILNDELPSLGEEEGAPDPKQHDLRPDEPENTWSQSGNGPGKAESKRRAFDSDLETEEAESGERSRGARQEDGRKKGRAEGEDPYHYLPEAELTPAGNAWERAEEYYVYLAGEVRYHGFETLEGLLPLWVYRGDQIPELLDKTKQWRFLGRLPLQVRTAGELPKDVKDFLYGLKRAAAAAKAEEAQGGKKAEGQDGESSAAAGTGKKDAGDKISALYDSFEKDAKALRPDAEDEGDSGSDKPATQADTLEEIFDHKKEGKAASSPVDLIGEKVKEHSPAIEAFLERRKKKERKSAPIAEKVDSKNPYLGIYVALSNSYNPSKDGLKSVARVLRAIEMSFGRCACVLLDVAGEDGLAPVLLGSGEITEGSRAGIDSAYPIRRSESEDPMGYLLLRPTGDREGFSDEEVANIRKVITAIWPAIANGRRAA